ncbi:hypothetical protein FKR81_03865 [Lentzea tibetensis]|uniref:Uncharacterized protein n=1 Tax=Lentzea tibetensis TaxID=2591470 RepID=A0A563F2C0_9PSEU|nr:hypothetical protein [Lentzea tibetensis]TWP53901.1 hypothetical protein FKR81_03865 [Lentzea tibetensis]
MNPDLHNSIRSGRPTKTVFLTAGEGGFAPEPGKDTEPTAQACRDGARGRRWQPSVAGARARGAVAACDRKEVTS